MKIILMWVVFLLFSGCALSNNDQDKYDDLRYQLLPGYSSDRVDIGYAYSYRFLESYRISHQWISGPNTMPCRYPWNVYRLMGGYGDLMKEKRGPFFEKDGVLSISNLYGKEFVPAENLNIYTLGENNGVFEKYRPFCSQFFLHAAVGMSLYIIKPDEKKGVNEYVDGAESTVVSGLNWLHKEVSPHDERYRYRPAAVPVEYWVLKIPESSYWMVLIFTLNPKTTFQHPEELVYLQNLFYGIVSSVKLEPIAPLEYGVPSQVKRSATPGQ